VFRTTIATVAVVAASLLAGPAFAQMKMSSPTGAASSEKAFSWGAYAGFETDNSLSTWGPGVGLNLDMSMGGGLSALLTPRFTYGINYQSAIKVPLTLRQYDLGGTGLYGGFGPYFGYGFGAASPSVVASPSLDVGALIDVGYSIPMGDMTLDIGGEVGYGFLNPASGSLPWTAMFKIGGRM